MEGAYIADMEIDDSCILSQDFFCTPDYITPNCQIPNNLDCNSQEGIPCPKSPEKIRTAKSKRPRIDGMLNDFYGSDTPCHEQIIDLGIDSFASDVLDTEKSTETKPKKNQRFVSQSAVALRCRVMPPPIVKNEFVKNGSGTDADHTDDERLKCPPGFLASLDCGEGLSRYMQSFHEIGQIGTGNFSCVYKAVNRLDGIVYAVKKGSRLLTHDKQRRKALMEVHAYGAIGLYKHLVGYNTSWFQDGHLYIQLELCDHSLALSMSSKVYPEVEVLEILYQIAKALQFMHRKGMAHLDLKPDNIYVKDGTYKLGDLGCATKLDGSLPIEEGDARYMPHEILNDNYDHLDKVDIFSLGVTIYELVRGSPLPESGHVSLNLREGKVPLFPGHSLQFQNLLKAMLDRDPLKRPSAREVVQSPIFDKMKRSRRAK